MNEDCRECLQVKQLEDKIKSLWHQIEESKEQRKDFEVRISSLERKLDVTEEKFDRIFTAIESIEKNIEKIVSALDEAQTKNAKKYDNLGYEIVKYLVILAVGIAVAKIFHLS